ncbi:RluA family pseudouridine synthase [Maricaulaceae bacterium NA33B04]|nr:RluA family pseudouridine synthase [Maricaulaceae bacterium NA33B04]
MSGVQNLTVTEDEADARVDRWFKRRFPHVPHGMVEKLLRKGQIRVDGGRAKGNQRLEVGQTVRVPPLPDPGEVKESPPISREDAQFVRSLVIYEDKQIIAFNKPPGLAVQGGSKITHHMDRLLEAFGKGDQKPRLVHRLDKDTSGVLVVAKTAQAAKRLSRLFQTRDVVKTYWAVVLGLLAPKAGEVKGFLKKSSGDGDRELMVAAHHGEPSAQHALTRYAVADNAGARASWVVLRPETGRTHQLRVHMMATGHSILGDGKYTCDIPVPEGLSKKLHLHARRIEIPRQGQKPLVLEADLPRHMAASFDALGFNPKDNLMLVEEALT